ncbi:MAG: recombinase family protein, partial [Patescibacteria group bacterium]
AKENIWRLVLSLLAIMDELASTLYQGNIRAAHTSRAEKREVWGALTFGYKFSESDESDLGSKRRRYEIDPVAADWVRKIFQWFTRDGISVNEILRRLLGTPGVPVPPWTRTGTWSRPVLSRVLRNQRYRGDWSYGWFDRTWNTAKDCVKIRKRSEPLQRIQHEELRIIDEQLWQETEVALEGNKGDRGRKTSDGKRQPTTFLLSGLLYCKEHNQLLYRSGEKGEDYFRCPNCIGVDAEKRPVFTFCDGQLALNCLLKALQEKILGDDCLVQQIISACRLAAEGQSRPGDAELEVHHAAVRKLTRSIDLLVDNPGDSKEDQRESSDRLKRLRAERNKHGAQLEKIRKQMTSPATVPTAEQVKSHLQDLSATMQRVINDPNLDLDGLSAARKIIRRFTGGKVLISQAGERKQHHGWLLAEFENDFIKLCADELGGGDLNCSSGNTRVVVEIRRPDANAELGKTVVEMRDQEHLTYEEISHRLNTTRNRVSRLYYKYAPADAPGRTRANGKQFRCQSERPLPERIADEAMALLDQGLLCNEVCEQLGISKETLTAATKYWYQ